MIISFLSPLEVVYNNSNNNDNGLSDCSSYSADLLGWGLDKPFA